MKFISVRDFRVKPGRIWKNLAKDRELIATSNDRPIGLLVDINEENPELFLNAYRQTRAFLWTVFRPNRIRKARIGSPPVKWKQKSGRSGS